MNIRRVLTWTAGFLAFPIAGLAGRAVAGPVDDPVAAVLGGGITGLVIGVGQVLAARGLLDPRRWVPATGLGMAAGLGLGAAAVGYGTSLGELAAMGALTAIPLGLAQALALPVGRRARLAWAVAAVPLWALGWTVTTAFGIDVESQYTVFGSTGAITVSLLSGLLLELLRSVQGTGTPRSAAVRRMPAQVG
jgi:hypothetical protein